MTTLLLPVAGNSSRFPGMRPKWLLTMPSGDLMYEQAIKKLDLMQFEKIRLVVLRDHLERYISEGVLTKALGGLGHPDVSAIILEKPTSSQSETVANAIKAGRLTGPMFIKDCDNEFSVRWSGGNEVSVINLSNVDFVDAKNKSYVSLNPLGHIDNIVEKEVISTLFCSGGYGFKSADDFLKAFRKIEKIGEIYVSHVIYQMILDGEVFTPIDAHDYTDWGTAKEYLDYKNRFVTVFCDLDGVLFENGSKFSSRGWKTPVISENLKFLIELEAAQRMVLVITTSRPESERDYVVEKLSSVGLHPAHLIMGLPHNKRVLINDFSSTNPYPTALSLNIERDSRNLSNTLRSLLS